jgi:hypothetical protein
MNGWMNECGKPTIHFKHFVKTASWNAPKPIKFVQLRTYENLCRSTGQEIPGFVWNPKVHCCRHNSPCHDPFQKHWTTVFHCAVIPHFRYRNVTSRFGRPICKTTDIDTSHLYLMYFWNSNYDSSHMQFSVKFEILTFRGGGGGATPIVHAV